MSEDEAGATNSVIAETMPPRLHEYLDLRTTKPSVAAPIVRLTAERPRLRPFKI